MEKILIEKVVAVNNSLKNYIYLLQNIEAARGMSATDEKDIHIFFLDKDSFAIAKATLMDYYRERIEYYTDILEKL